MNIAIIKNGATVSFDSASIAVGEVLSIANVLAYQKDNTVSILTKKLKKDNTGQKDNIFIKDINIEKEHINDYDVLIMVNGAVNFFGGAEDPLILNNYYCISHFNKNIFYFLCDNRIPFTDMCLSKRKFYKDNPEKYNVSDYDISDKCINYITQSFDVDGIKQLAKKNFNNIGAVEYFPFEMFPLFTASKDQLSSIKFNESPEYDILYGGTFRGGKREDDMVKFFFGYNEDINVTMFGLKEDDFKKEKIKGLRPPMFEKLIPYSEYCNKMNSSLSTILIGDPSYKKYESMAQRAYESVLALNVVFIDSSYDRHKKLFESEILHKYCYVNSLKDVQKNLSLIKNDTELRKTIIRQQLKDVINKFGSKEQYSNNLIKKLLV